MIGTVLDKYEILQKLGEGATATVYRGRHTTIGRDVAIKVLHPHLSASSRYRERFSREARAVGRLAHPNIVSILDYSGAQAEECYIVTELVDGQTLQQVLQQHGRLPSEIVTMIGLELASALGFAHNHNIVHRDLKPENIMIRRDGQLKLMDFGIARMIDERSITLEGSLLGSPAYMSPQQAMDESIDGRSDLFSLGTVLFHSVTGHVPFSGTNPSVILRNIIDGNRPEVLELAPDVAPGLAAVIDRLMQTKAEDRYPRAEETHTALLNCLAEVDLPPDHPILNLRVWLVEPESTNTHLITHLKRVLLEKGRARLSAGDHLGALQLLNRLLAIDEDNKEVIALIQSLHQAPPPPRRPWMAVAAAFAVLGLAGVTWWLYPEREAQPVTPITPVAVAPVPITPLPTPEPTPSPLPITPIPTPAPHILTPPAFPAPSPTVVASRPSASAEPASLAITSSTWADIWVDGKKIGKTRTGPMSDWVASPQNPLKLSPGEHQLLLLNDHSEPHEEHLVMVAGEHKTLRIELQRKPVNFTVNPRMPRDCAVTVGSTHYASVREFGGTFTLKQPTPDTAVVFDCPAPVGRLLALVGPTSGGETIIIPTTLSLPTDTPAGNPP